MGSNGMAMGAESHIFIDLWRWDCLPVGGVACSTVFLSLEEGLNLHNNCVAHKAGELAGNMDASSLSELVALILFIKAC